MPPWNIRQNLRDAQMLIRENTIVIWWIALIGLLSSTTLLLKETPLFWPMNVLVTILSIISTPVIYGIFFELIEDRYSSIPTITRAYVPGYIWLIIRMYLPPIFLASMLISLLAGGGAFDGGGFLELTLVLFSLLYLFVIPFYYRNGTGSGAITAGVSFLMKNLSGATPIIFMVLLLESSMLLLQYQRNSIGDGASTIFVAVDFLIFFVASLIDYAIFIILILILKEHNRSIDPTS